MGITPFPPRAITGDSRVQNQPPDSSPRPFDVAPSISAHQDPAPNSRKVPPKARVVVVSSETLLAVRVEGEWAGALIQPVGWRLAAGRLMRPAYRPEISA